MKKTQIKQLIKEEILNILKEDKRPLSNKLGLDFEAKKLARKVKSILDRIEQDPKYIESKLLFDSGKMGKRKFEDIVRKELLTREEHKIFDEIVNDSRRGTIDYRNPYHRVGRSNLMKRAVNMGLNIYGFGTTYDKNIDVFEPYKY
jgi:hypothetical protein